jgi:hypothetical protein
MAKEKTKRGRPPGDPAANLSQLVTFRLTEAELGQCEVAAIKADLTLREWLRAAVVKAVGRAAKGR